MGIYSGRQSVICGAAVLSSAAVPSLVVADSVTAASATAASATAASATTTTVSVAGTDVIFLAGRSDVTIPAAGTVPPASFPLLRNTPVGPYAEAFPAVISAGSGQTFQFAASGMVNFNTTNTFTTFGPDGSTLHPSAITPLAGVSGYDGPPGSLVGLFLTDADPQNSAPPATQSFAALSNFATLSPALGQTFFIGDGLTGTGTGTTQTFVAPAGATRLFFGVADAPNFAGPPGGYDDNAGAFLVNVTTTAVPEPSSLLATLAVPSLLRRLRGGRRR